MLRNALGSVAKQRACCLYTGALCSAEPQSEYPPAVPASNSRLRCASSAGDESVERFCKGFTCKSTWPYSMTASSASVTCCDIDAVHNNAVCTLMMASQHIPAAKLPVAIYYKGAGRYVTLRKCQNAHDQQLSSTLFRKRWCGIVLLPAIPS